MVGGGSLKGLVGVEFYIYTYLPLGGTDSIFIDTPPAVHKDTTGNKMLLIN